MVSDEDRPNAVVLYSMIVNVSRIFGPTLAGILVVTVGYGWCFTVDAVSYLVVLTALKMMRPEELRKVPPAPRRKGDVREGLQYVARMPKLRIPFTMLLAVGMLAYNFNVTLPLLVTDALHGGDAAFTLLYATFSVGAVVSALVVANRKLVDIQHIVWGAAALGTTMVVLALVPTVPTAVPAALLVGLASILYMTSTTAIVQVEADPALHGRVLALQTVLLVGTTPIGGPILGWLSDLTNARVPMVLGGVVCALAAAWGHVASRRIADDEPTTPALVG
jgi:MFS family permease